jgi:hypothetical protein
MKVATNTNSVSKMIIKEKSLKSKAAIFVKNVYKKEKNKINKNNVIYYFVGFTLVIIFFIYITPIIYSNLTKANTKNTKIEFSKEVKAATTEETTKLSQVDLTIKQPKSEAIKELKVSSKEEMLKIFQQFITDKNLNNLQDYIEKDASLFVWKPSELKSGSCCLVENVNSEYITNFIRVLNLENPVWNFDQTQPDIKGVQDIESRFKDNFIATNSKNVLLGIKTSTNNKISEINVTLSIKEVYNSTIDYNASDFKKINLTEDQLNQIKQNKL